MFYAITALIVVAFTLLNRLRGGGFFKTPIDSRQFCVPIVMGLAYLAGVSSIIAMPWFAPVWKPIVDAVIFGVCWYVWAVPPWSDWMDLGYYVAPNPRPPTTFEKIIDKVGFGNDYVCLWIRFALFLIPMAVLFNGLFFVLSFALLAAYQAGWWFNTKFPKLAVVALDEWIAGFAWGIFVALVTAGF